MRRCRGHTIRLWRIADCFRWGIPGPLELMESSGLYNQNQLISNVNAKLNAGLSLFGFYVYNRARSNTDGIGTFPANPYNFPGRVRAGVHRRAPSRSPSAGRST